MKLIKNSRHDRMELSAVKTSQDFDVSYQQPKNNQQEQICQYLGRESQYISLSKC
jgi:hypothetical protein